MKFYRFGTLTPQSHPNYANDECYHYPPVKYGVYAFPQGKIEYFLLGATYSPLNPSCKSSWLKDENGNIAKWEDLFTVQPLDVDELDSGSTNKQLKPYWRNYLKKHNIKMKNVSYYSSNDKYCGCAYYYKKPKCFNYDGKIWHHLKDVTDNKFILKESGTWVLTDMEVYEMAFKKQDTQERRNTFYNLKRWESTKNRVFGNPNKYVNSYVKDTYEVFIEKIK